MTITHLALVSVPVTDQERAKTFYTEQLGFTVVRELALGEQRWVELAPPGSTATLNLVTWFSQMAPGSLQGLVFDTENIVQAAEELKARSVRALCPVQRS